MSGSPSGGFNWDAYDGGFRPLRDHFPTFQADQGTIRFARGDEPWYLQSQARREAKLLMWAWSCRPTRTTDLAGILIVGAPEAVTSPVDAGRTLSALRCGAVPRPVLRGPGCQLLRGHGPCEAVGALGTGPGPDALFAHAPVL